MAESAGLDEHGVLETVLIDRPFVGPQTDVLAGAQKNFFEYRQFQRSLLAAPDEASWSKVVEDTDWESIRSISVFIDHMQFRRFGRTRNGRLGWMPFTAEEGDQICVFEGMELPYAVRQREGPEGLGNYVLVGECFIPSLLNGEAMELPDVDSTIINIE